MREFRKEHSGSAEWKRKASNRSLKFRYGITLDQRQAMFDAQNGCCKICLCALQPGRGTHLDHDHKTGAVRALLCFRCNHYIGHIKENMESVKRLAEYLKG